MSSAAQPVPAKPLPGWKQLLKLLPYLSSRKDRVAIGLVTLAVMGIVGTLLPLTFGVIMDCLAGNAQPLGRLSQVWPGLVRLLIPGYQPSSPRTLILYCLIALAIVAIKGLFSFWTRSILIGLSRDIEYDLRNDLLERLLALVLAVLFMFQLSPSLSFWVLIPVPIVALSVRRFGRTIHALYEKIQASLATLSAKAQENLAGVRVVRAYAQEPAEMRGFDAPNREYVSRNLKLIAAWSMFMPALQALIGVAFVLVLWFGGRQVIVRQISLGEFVAFYTYMGQLAFPMIALGFVTNIFQRGAASMRRLNYILEAKPAINDAHAGPPAAIRGDIEFRHLSFTYPTVRNDAAGARPQETGTPILHDISFHLPAGSTLAIVGPTGCGKSTLAALIARLWEAPPGTLLVDGRSIREWPLAALRQAIGFVPQDTFLFSETVRENIAWGLDSASDEKVAEAAEIASIAPEIAGFPSGYATFVGERGITLSGGQKQRSALARAVIRDPRILILDDALSSVDTDTEERILRRLKELMKQRTTLLISHRVSTVRHADQIIVLRDGRIVERGTHDQLLAQGGYYEDLYQKQLLEEELERA